MKIDTKKAFDSLDWNFLLKVLQTFGFAPVFCRWIESILHSAKLSIAVNAKASRYFSWIEILCLLSFSALQKKFLAEVSLNLWQMVLSVL